MFRRGKTKTAKASKEDDSLSLINSSSGEDAANNNNTGKRRFKKLLGPSKTKSKSSISSGENDIVGGVIHSKSSVPSSDDVANNSGTPANKQSKQSTGLSGQKAALEEEMSPRSKLDPPGTIKKSNVSKSKSNSNNNIKNNKTNNLPNRQSTAAVASTSLPQTTSASATTATSLFQNTKSNPQRHHGETSSFASSAESETTTSQTITSQTITSQSITSTSQNKNSAGGGGGGGVAALRKNQHNNMMIMMHPGNGADGFGSISAGDGTKNNNNGMAMMTRSGWSITSNASSAMNSENYIQSLDDMPAGNAFRAGKVNFLLFIFSLIPLHFYSVNLMISITLSHTHFSFSYFLHVTFDWVGSGSVL